VAWCYVGTGWGVGLHHSRRLIGSGLSGGSPGTTHWLTTRLCAVLFASPQPEPQWWRYPGRLSEEDKDLVRRSLAAARAAAEVRVRGDKKGNRRIMSKRRRVA
jgi:hypothetical protein